MLPINKYSFIMYSGYSIFILAILIFAKLLTFLNKICVYILSEKKITK